MQFRRTSAKIMGFNLVGVERLGVLELHMVSYF